MFSKAKISSYYNKKYQKEEVFIINPKITVDIINQIFELFHYNRLVIITEIKNDDKSLNKLEQSNIKYTVINQLPNKSYVEIGIKLYGEDLNKQLNQIITTIEEDYYIYSIKQKIRWDTLFTYDDSSKLTEFSDFTLLVSKYESVIQLTYDTKIYDSNTIKKAIKEIF